MHPLSKLVRILPTLPVLAMEGYAYRVVDYKYLVANPQLHPNRILYSLGAPATGARFTIIGGPPMVYLAEQLGTAIQEANSVNTTLSTMNPAATSPSDRSAPRTSMEMKFKIWRG